MTEFDKLVEGKVEILINGGTTTIPDDEVKTAMQKRLREIKSNCTIVLSQLKEL